MIARARERIVDPLRREGLRHRSRLRNDKLAEVKQQKAIWVVFCDVVGSSPSSPFEGQQRAYRVEAPRLSDAVGLSLRDAYPRDTGLPDDMRAMLRRLDGLRIAH